MLGQTVIQFPVADAKTPAEALARADAFIRQFKDDPLITPAVAPHAMYTLDGPTLKAARELSRQHGVPTLIHLAETRDEIQAAQERFAMSPTAYLDSLGFWGPGVLAAHGVWVSEADIAMLKQRGVGVSHNPESNMKLASGAAPVTGYLRAGVAIGLGTDGAASNNDLDMFEAMRVASLLHKLQTADPRARRARPRPSRWPRWAGPGRSGWIGSIGSLERGQARRSHRGGDARSARQTPLYDPVSHLVYTTRGDDVRHTVVNGRVLMRDRKVLTLDTAAVLAEARAWAEKVRAAVR